MVVQFLALLAAGLGTAFALDKWVGHETPTLFYLAVFGSFISYIYSAPPLKLKQSGWAGNYALGSSYISLPWWAGQVNITLAEYYLYSKASPICSLQAAMQAPYRRSDR